MCLFYLGKTYPSSLHGNGIQWLLEHLYLSSSQAGNLFLVSKEHNPSLREGQTHDVDFLETVLGRKLSLMNPRYKQLKRLFQEERLKKYSL